MADKATIEGELRVKEILKERGMKMKDLAEQMDIAPETLTRVLRGNPQFSTLKTTRVQASAEQAFRPTVWRQENPDKRP